MDQQIPSPKTSDSIVFNIGHDPIIISRRYQLASIINDFLIGLWFLFGSGLLFFPQWENAAIWCFVIGSAEFLIRPIIRLIHHVHINWSPANTWDM